MSRIDEMIQRLCPDGVEYKKLGEVIRPCFGERITKTKAKGTLYPVYGGGGESFRTDTTAKTTMLFLDSLSRL